MPVGDPQAIPLAELMAQHEPTWEVIRKQHSLKFGLKDLVGTAWPIAEGHFKRDYDGIVHPLKLRKHGFAGYRDTEDSVLEHLAKMTQDNIIPRGV